MYERIREEALLTDEEKFKAIYGITWEEFQPQLGYEDAQKITSYVSDSDYEKIAQAQVDKVLKHKRVRIEAENQDLPENPFFQPKEPSERKRMTKETKYYCDECGKELGRGVFITVLVTNQYQYDLDKWDLEKFNKIPYTHKIVYNKAICPECVGERIQEYSGTEPSRDFGLMEKGRRFLVKYGFMKEEHGS